MGEIIYMEYFQKKYLKNNVLRKILILVFFLLLSIALTYPLWHVHRMTAFSDWSFHASRVQEIFLNLKRHNIFTFIASSTFNSTGVASFLFYPTIFLYPWAFLRFVFSPISSYYVWYTCFNFLTLIIAYLCMKDTSKSDRRAIIFALLYTLSARRIYLGVTGYVLGEFIASIFLPLAFFGIYKIFYTKNHDWIMLSIGMSLIVYSHILSVFITVQFLTIFVLIQLFRKKITFKIFKNLLKAIFLTFGLSLGIIFPFLTDYIGHNIEGPRSGVLILESASDFVQQSLANSSSGMSIGIVLLIILLTGWILFNKFNFVDKIMYISAIFACNFSTSIFPWMLISNSVFGVIQLPWRYLSYACLFLAIIGSKIMTAEYWLTSYFTKCLALLVMIVCFISYFGAVQNQVKENSVVQKSYLKKNTVGLKQIPISVQLNNSNYNYQFGYSVKNGETDYYPNKAFKYAKSIQKHIVIIDGNRRKKITPSPMSNGIMYAVRLKHDSKIDIPVLKYSNTIVFDNGKAVSSRTSYRDTPIINGKRGVNSIVVK